MENPEQSKGKKQLIKVKNFKDSLNKVGAKEARHTKIYCQCKILQTLKRKGQKKKKKVKPTKCQRTSVIVNFFPKKLLQFILPGLQCV